MDGFVHSSLHPVPSNHPFILLLIHTFNPQSIHLRDIPPQEWTRISTKSGIEGLRVEKIGGELSPWRFLIPGPVRRTCSLFPLSLVRSFPLSHRPWSHSLLLRSSSVDAERFSVRGRRIRMCRAFARDLSFRSALRELGHRYLSHEHRPQGRLRLPGHAETERLEPDAHHGVS